MDIGRELRSATCARPVVGRSRDTRIAHPCSEHFAPSPRFAKADHTMQWDWIGGERGRGRGLAVSGNPDSPENKQNLP